MKYRIYIDEVGNSDLESSDNEVHRFFSLTGVILSLEYVKTRLFPELELLKQEFFQSHPDSPIILHRKELVNAHHPFKSLRNKEIRKAFDSRLLRLISDWDYNVITVCMDKREHKERYQIWRYDPYHYCLTLIMERYIGFLEKIKAHGDALAESRGREDLRLKAAFRRLWNNGTEYINPDKFQMALTSKELKVKLKRENIAGLQLADILAHPSRNEILRDRNLLKRSITAFGENIISILQAKYLQIYGRIEGWGKKFIP